MTEDIFEQLRSEVEGRMIMPSTLDKESLRRRAEAEMELERQLQQLQHFRTHIFPTAKQLISLMLEKQHDKVKETGLTELISIDFPVIKSPETKFGYLIPIGQDKSGRIKLLPALITAAMPSKHNRYYLITFKADSINSTFDAAVDVSDDLGRRVQELPATSFDVDAFTEFKEGEFIVAIQKLVNTVIENCMRDVIETLREGKTVSE